MSKELNKHQRHGRKKKNKNGVNQRETIKTQKKKKIISPLRLISNFHISLLAI